jgi:hypothetical protein
MKNKTNFFSCFLCTGIVSGSFIRKKIKEQGFLRKSHQKHTPWIRDPEKFIPDPDPGSRG